ncbi:MAG: DNA internalization-related competence protein ComEC/Rec2 [Gammaproteobacteria bacterium]
MLLYSIIILMAAECSQIFSHLLSLWLLVPLLFITLCLPLKYPRLSLAYLPFIFIFSMALCSWKTHHILQVNQLENKPVKVIGYIASLPISANKQTSFLFQTKHMLMRLSWMDNPFKLKVGDKWQLNAKLKNIHGTQNPGAFDFEAWSLQKGLQATGSVVKGSGNALLTHDYLQYPLEQFRQKLQDKIQENMPNTPTSPWLMALILGERNGIAKEDWDILRNTGTNHLMAIAGLHIGIVSGLMHLLVSRIWRQFPKKLLRLPAEEAGACAALLTAIVYSALAGFSIPTQRACLMLSIFICMRLSNRYSSAWQAWSLALIIVLIINPLSILTESFWLSFGTLALIIYGMSSRLKPEGFWWKWGRVQWVIGFGLTPLSLLLFQECSIVSLAANSIAIPWLEFLILPFCLLSVICIFLFPIISHFLLFIADKSLAILWSLLAWFSSLPFSAWHHAIPNTSILLIGILGFVLLLLPKGFHGKWLGVLWLLPILFFNYPRPDKGDIWLTLLDVGQGLSVVIQTQHHVLVYDAGPNIAGNDAGEHIVLPYLRTIGANRVDALVISHGDNDHIGGSSSIMRALPVLSIKTSVPEKFSTGLVTTCLAGQHWEWDGVGFSFLYPTEQNFGLTNDSSCVLKIENQAHQVLLTGDIERYAEEQLLLNSAPLKADLLIAPHHGSKTSDLLDFIKSVDPKFVFYATGYQNRYHFPHAEVVRRYDNLGVKQLNTVDTGAIFVKLLNKDSQLVPVTYRKSGQAH